MKLSGAKITQPESCPKQSWPLRAGGKNVIDPRFLAPDFDPKKWIDSEIADRTVLAKKLAEKFPEWRGLSYEDFLQAMLDFGIDLDFITSVELHKALSQA